VLGRSWPTERLDALGFSAPGLPARVQQVLERLSLYGLVGHAPGTEACHHRAVRASQRRRVWVIGQVEAVAFGQLRWSVCFSHAALNVTRRLLPDQTLFSRVRGRCLLRSSQRDFIFPLPFRLRAHDRLVHALLVQLRAGVR
jgi:hypothetical protein